MKLLAIYNLLYHSGNKTPSVEEILQFAMKNKIEVDKQKLESFSKRFGNGECNDLFESSNCFTVRNKNGIVNKVRFEVKEKKDLEYDCDCGGEVCGDYSSMFDGDDRY